MFAKNVFLEWKRIEKKRKGRSFRKEETMFLSLVFLPIFFVNLKSNNKESKHYERTHEERTNQQEEEVKRKSKENQFFIFFDKQRETK